MKYIKNKFDPLDDIKLSSKMILFCNTNQNTFFVKVVRDTFYSIL